MTDITRRQALRSAGTVCTSCTVGAVGTSKLSEPAFAQDGQAESLDLPPVEPSETVHAVDDLGWDPSGEEPIDGKIPWEDVHIQIPPGMYLSASKFTEQGIRNWILEGMGESHQDVQFVIPAGEERRIFDLKGCENIRVRNLSFNQRFDWETAIGNIFVGPDNIVLEHIELIGNEDRGTKDLSVRATHPDGTAVVNGFRRVGGTHLVDYGREENNAMCFHAGPDHVGTLILRNFDLANCGSSGIYASRTTGPVRVEGGRFMNIQNAPIRVSGAGSIIRNVTIIIDTEHEDTEKNRGEFHQTRGIWWESGFQGQSGGVIDGVHIICRSTPATPGLLRINGTAGRTTIRNVRIENFVDDMPYIWARTPGSSGMGGRASGSGQYPYAVTIENVHLIGPSSGSRPAIHIEDRPGSSVSNACLNLSGDRSGIALVNCADSMVTNCGVAVSGIPVQTPLSPGAIVRGISETASCLAPTAAPRSVGGSLAQRAALEKAVKERGNLGLLALAIPAALVGGVLVLILAIPILITAFVMTLLPGPSSDSDS